MPRAKPDKRPWFPLYATDYLGDPDLARCSLAAQGLWMRLLCLIHLARADGKLLLGKSKATPEGVAREVGRPLREVRALLDELTRQGVLTWRRGHLISRRMERDAKRSRKGSENGAKGGNPALGSASKKLAPPEAYAEGVNPTDNPAVKPQSPETRDQSKHTHTARAPTAAEKADAIRDIGERLGVQHPVTDWRPTTRDLTEAKKLGLTLAELTPIAAEFIDFWTGKGERSLLGWSGQWLLQVQKKAPAILRARPRGSTSSQAKPGRRRGRVGRLQIEPGDALDRFINDGERGEDGGGDAA